MNYSDLPLAVPEWRNWQTRQVQDLVLAREWRFESSFGHQITYEFTKTMDF